MHDLHVADKILRLALKQAKKGNLKKISKIVVELGKIIEHDQRITPENLKFNIGMLAKGTIAENTKIEIRPIKGNYFVLKEIYGK